MRQVDEGLEATAPVTQEGSVRGKSDLTRTSDFQSPFLRPIANTTKL